MINAVYLAIQQFKSQKGQGLTEYAFIIMLIAMVLMLALSLIPDPINRILAFVSEALRITP